MKLNLDLLADYLEKGHKILKRIVFNDEMDLEYAQLYDGEKILKTGIVYIAKAKELVNNPEFTNHSMVISIGHAPENYVCGRVDYIEISENESVNVIMNAVVAGFEKYTIWYRELQKIIIEQSSIQKMLEYSLPLFENPMSVCDLSYRVIAFVEEEEKVAIKNLYKINKYGYFAQDFLNKFKQSDGFDQLFSNTKPKIWKDNIYDFVCLNNTIYMNGVVYGKIVVDERVRKFVKGDYALLEALTRAIEMALEHRITLNNQDHYSDQLLSDVLEGKIKDMKTLDIELKTLGWKRHESYFCMFIQQENALIDDNVIFSTCHHIESTLIKCRAFPYEKNIVVIVPADCWSGIRTPFLSSIAPILYEGGYRAGISQIYNDFYELKEYYKQAEVALSTGLKCDMGQWMYKFEDYVLDYFIDGCMIELSPKMLCHNSILSLLAYDKAKKTEYFKTLRAYIINNSSATTAMEELYLHKSTFFYRLKRVRELVSFDIDDADTKLYLLILFKILDKEAER